MGAWADLRERRLFQIIASYAAAGWLVLEGVNQLVGREVVPEIFYYVALVLYIAGLPASVVIGWYHGEKGHQRVTRREVFLLASIGVVAVGAAGLVVRGHYAEIQSARAALESGLDTRTVAVMEFRDRSGDEELAALASGLTSDLIGELRAVGPIRVISRNGVARFTHAGVSRDSVARGLDAATLVEGQVERAGDGRLRISVQVVDGASGTTVARQGFERSTGDLLAVRDEVVSEVARLLRTTVGEEIELRGRRAEAGDGDAWLLVQRGERERRRAEDLLHQHDAHGAVAAFGRADSLLAAAAVLDTAWAEPLTLRAGLAYEQAKLSADVHGAVAHIDRGLGFAVSALRRSPKDPEALLLRGNLRYLRWMLRVTHNPDEAAALLDAARRDLEAAAGAAPHLASAWSTLSHLRYQSKDIAGAVIAARRAYEEDAYLRAADGVLWRLFLGHFDLGQFNQAERWCAEGVRRFPDHYRFAECRLWMMVTPVARVEPGHMERAWALARQSVERAPAPVRPFQAARTGMVVGGVLAKAGLTDSADVVLVRSRVDQSVDREQELLYIEAFMRSLADQNDLAMDLLKQYVAANPDHTFRRGSGIHWWWQPLTGEPEFRQIMRTD